MLINRLIRSSGLEEFEDVDVRCKLNLIVNYTQVVPGAANTCSPLALLSGTSRTLEIIVFVRPSRGNGGSHRVNSQIIGCVLLTLYTAHDVSSGETYE